MKSVPTIVRTKDIELDHWDDPVRGRVSWKTLLSADRTPSDSLVCGIACFDDAGILKEHRHPQSEMIHVLSGSGTARIDDLEYPMQPGDTIFVPGGMRHGFRSSGKGMSLLYVFGAHDFTEIDYEFSDL